ncbi:hypothetical protein KCU98_g1127, partial [Aureobasidium melanogenum]
MQDVRRILNKATESATETRRRLGIAKHYLEHTKEILDNVSKRMESIVTALEKEINDSVQSSINLIKAQIEQRKADIEKANECKKRQFKNYQLYHKAVKSMEELKYGEIDQRVGAIYCDGHDWLTESIARWEEENKKAEGEIRKLEWLMKN